MQLVIAAPSPFARKVRVALREKRIAHDETIDIPWNADTAAPAFNPLGKIPILVPDDGLPIYDSRVIIDYLETLGHAPALLPADPARRVEARQLEALADGVCDAVVLIVLERHRPSALQSADWIARQQAKVTRGLAVLDETCADIEDVRPWLVGDAMSVADIAAACAAAYVDLRLPDHTWREDHPALAAFSEAMEARPSFAATRPAAQEIAPVN